MALENDVIMKEELKDAETGVGIQSPWVTHWNLVKAMFARDNEITVSEIREVPPNEENDKALYEFDVESGNEEKIIAIRSILTNLIEMGNITLRINMVYSGSGGSNAVKDVGDITDDGDITLDDYKKAFENNLTLYDTISIKDVAGYVHEWVVFARDVVSFYNDDLLDPWGMWNGLYKDIAEKIFNSSNIMFTTAPDHVDALEYAIETE